MNNIFFDSRTRAGFTQRQAAESLGIPIRTWQNWEEGISNPPDYVKRLVLEHLEHEFIKATADRLISQNDPNNPDNWKMIRKK